MRFELQPHPAHPPSKAVTEIQVDAGRWPDGRLQLDYSLYGFVERLQLPLIGPPSRKDDLWKTTCFELFLRHATGYCEFNFSPSESWAAYHFTNYRAGMRPLDLPNPPELTLDDTGRWMGLDVLLTLPDEFSGKDLEFGLSAIIVEGDGRKSYWALVHSAGPPDFHDPSCFLARLPE